MIFILKFEKKIADSSSAFINPLYIFFITLSWRAPFSYRNQSIDLLCTHFFAPLFAVWSGEAIAWRLFNERFVVEKLVNSIGMPVWEFLFNKFLTVL